MYEYRISTAFTSAALYKGAVQRQGGVSDDRASCDLHGCGDVGWRIHVV